ncbi:MAG: peptidyl-prolyl cis-trans isomerase [Bradyrhizobiaceae bacterium]|nr:peptidyl-prolyl cis-trans isomerase [Bradyrhizobiaceae bacterium]
MIAALLIITCLCSLPTALAAQSADQPASMVGIVNADTLWLDAFAREVGRKSELNAMGGTASAADIMEQTWKSTVRRTVLNQEAAKRHITISQEQVDSVLLTDTPEFVRRGVLDAKGKFDKAMLRAMLFAPDSLARARLPKASAASIKKNADAIRSTMNQLRQRMADVLQEERLRMEIVQTMPVDTAMLKKKFDEWRHSATADVVYLPCKQQTFSPTDADVQAWYRADSLRYSTKTSMRQLGVLTWETTAAPFDSTLVLRNVRTFMSMINGEHNPEKRDSIWNSVAQTVQSTYTYLDPDSSSHELFYNEVTKTRGGKVGTCVGPIMHPDGIHIILVDSVLGKKKPVYAVRVILAPITAGQQTMDSIIAEVKSAVQQFRSGTSIETLAKTYHKTFVVTKWVAPSDKLFDSYRLVQAAFDTPVGGVTDPIDTPDHGIMLAFTIDTIPPGTMPIEAARERIVADMQADYACKSMTRQAESMRAVTTRLPDGRMFVAESIPTSSIWRDVEVDASGFVGPEVYDPTASLAIRRGTPNTIMGPFRGDAGWWVANVQSTQINTEVSFAQWLQTDGAMVLAEAQSTMWDNWLAKAIDSASVMDLRWMYFRY